MQLVYLHIIIYIYIHIYVYPKQTLYVPFDPIISHNKFHGHIPMSSAWYEQLKNRHGFLGGSRQESQVGSFTPGISRMSREIVQLLH